MKTPAKIPLFLSRSKKIGQLMVRYSYVLFRKVFPLHGDWVRSHPIPGEASPYSLLQGCGSDLSTALYRMGRRVDALPFLWCSPFGGSRMDSTGNLIPNTRTLACMRDMQSSESDFPTATGFDWELFRVGWEAGARWGESNPCKTEQAGSTYNAPDSQSIPLRSGPGVLNG